MESQRTLTMKITRAVTTVFASPHAHLIFCWRSARYIVIRRTAYAATLIGIATTDLYKGDHTMKELILTAVLVLVMMSTITYADIFVKAGDEIPISWNANPPEEYVVKYTLLVKQTLLGISMELATVVTNGYLIRTKSFSSG